MYHDPFKEVSTKAKSVKNEKRLAKKYRFKRMPASGAIIKGDFRTEDYVLDLKETEGKEQRIRLIDLAKITREADGAGKKPGLIIRFRHKATGVASEWLLTPLEERL